MKIVLILLMTLFSNLSLAQECHFQFDQNQINVNYSGDEISIPFYINLHRPNNANSDLCEYAAFFFSKGNANSYERRVSGNGTTLRYTLENISPSGTLKDYGDHSGPHEFLATEILLNHHKVLTGVFKMPVQDTAFGNGHLQDVVNVTVYAYKSDNNNRRGMTKQLVINVQKNVTMGLSIVPEGAEFSAGASQAMLDFGRMYEGQELGSDLIIKSNIGYKISMSSLNDGQFKHVSKNSFIPYTFKFDQISQSLAGTSSSPKLLVTKTSNSVPAGDRYNMRFRVGSIFGRPSGQYADHILITVQSN